MGYEISQEYQEGSTQLPRSRLYFAWEKYVDYYREVYGEVGRSLSSGRFVKRRATKRGYSTLVANALSPRIATRTVIEMLHPTPPQRTTKFRATIACQCSVGA